MRLLPIAIAFGLASAQFLVAEVQGQPPELTSPYYHPLSHPLPPGMAGNWAGALGRAECHYFQPVEFRVPEGAVVSVVDPQARGLHPLDNRSMAGFLVGPVYRLKVSDIPGYPGVELFPTVELVDRLHPPAALKLEYPIPVELSPVDIAQAAQDQLVTKIVYLEQPDLALPQTERDTIREEEIAQSREIMTEADLRGRPVLILRIGGRVPSPHELSDPRLTPMPPVQFLPAVKQ